MARAKLQLLDKPGAAKDYSKAITLYRDAGLTADTEFAALVNELSQLYQEEGDLTASDSIINTYSTDLPSEEMDESGVISLINRGSGYFNNKQLDKAEEYYNKALEHKTKLSASSRAGLYHNLSLWNYEKGIMGQAEQYAMQARELFERETGTKNEGYVSVLNTMGMIYTAMGYYADAELRFKEAIALSEELPEIDRRIYAKSLQRLSTLYLRMGRHGEGKKLLEGSLALRAEFEGKQSTTYASVLSDLASYYRVSGNYDQAETLYIQAWDIVGDSNTEVSSSVLENLGRLYLELRKFNLSDSLINRAMKINAGLFGPEGSRVADNLFDLARVRQASGNYSEAEPLYRRSIDILRKVYGERHPEYLNCLNSMGVYYQLLGNRELAKDIYLKIIHSADHTSPQFATVLQNLSALYQLEGDYRSAEPLLTEALQIDSLIYGTEHPAYAVSLQNLASLYQRMEIPGKAEPLFMKAMAIDKKTYGVNHPSYAHKLYNLAVLYQEMEEYEQALPLFEEAIEIRRATLGANHPDYAYSLYGLAVLHQSMGNDRKALPLYREVINNYQQQIRDVFPMLSEKEKAAFYNKIRPVFEDYKDFAIEYAGNMPEILSELYDFQLNNKAILLNSSTKIRNRILRSGDTDLVALYNRWTDQKELLVRYYALSRLDQEKLNIDIRQMEIRANALEKELSERSELFAKMYDKRDVSWRDVKDRLDDNEVAIEMIRVRKNLKNDSVIYAGLIIRNDTRNYPELVILRNGRDLEGREYKRYINTIRFIVPNEISYKVYWEPFLSVIADRSVIYLSPDGIYNKLNLNTLWDKPSDQFLVDRATIKILGNISELVLVTGELNSNANKENKAALVGYPDYQLDQYNSLASSSNTPENVDGTIFRNGIEALPGTKVEVEKLERILGDAHWRTFSLTGKDALEENVKMSASPKVLHLATHGFFLDDVEINRLQNADLELAYQQAGRNPLLRSGLIFAGAEAALRKKSLGLTVDIAGEDGILTAYEAMNLNLDNTELVVLSACETGLGEIKNGEGVYGLQRAFIIAGAKNLVMSLWKVDDVVTQQLMTRFYKHWLEEMDKTEAFYQAQREIKEEYPEPYYWGAFVIIGI